MITTMMLTYALVFHALSRSFAADFSLIVLLLVDCFPALSVFSCLTAIAAPLQRMYEFKYLPIRLLFGYHCRIYLWVWLLDSNKR